MFPTSLYFTPGFTEKREWEYWGMTSHNYKNDYKCVQYLQSEENWKGAVWGGNLTKRDKHSLFSAWYDDYDNFLTYYFT